MINARKLKEGIVTIGKLHKRKNDAKVDFIEARCIYSPILGP